MVTLLQDSHWVVARMTALAGSGRSVGVVEDAADPGLIGIKAFVADALPGDLVRADISGAKSRYVEGTLVDVVEPSPSRREPPCPVAMECGGCDLQALTYESQLELKHEMIVGAFRASKLHSVADQVRAIAPSLPLGYRRRFSFHIDSAGGVGLYRRRSRQVLSLVNCPVATDKVNLILEKLPLVALALEGIPATAIVESGVGEAGIALVVAQELRPETQARIAEALSALTPVWLLRIKDLIVRGPVGTLFALDAAGHSVSVPLGSFSQVNWEVNRRLVERVVELVTALPSRGVLDLYAGAGNFAIPIASCGIPTTAVEMDPQLVAAAQPVVDGGSLPLRYVCSSVERFLKKESAGGWDCLVVDPPRSGLAAAVSSLPRVPLVLLVSCHLPSCVRDVGALIGRGYQVQSIEPFDMFAQTSYLEVLSVLRRGD